jgi:hypothetical protein
VETAPPAGNRYQGAGFFKLDITEAALTYVSTPADHLVTSHGTPGGAGNAAPPAEPEHETLRCAPAAAARATCSQSLAGRGLASCTSTG